VYYEEERGRRTTANLLTKDEARRIAENIVKLPELSGRPQYQLRVVTSASSTTTPNLISSSLIRTARPRPWTVIL
jgi:hypothetical protein